MAHVIIEPPRLGECDTVAIQDTELDALFVETGSSVRGLSSREAAARLAVRGHNELPRQERRSLVARFLGQFADLFAVLLLTASSLTLAAYLLSTHSRSATWC